MSLDHLLQHCITSEAPKSHYKKFFSEALTKEFKPKWKHKLYGQTIDFSADEVARDFADFTEATKNRVIILTDTEFPLMTLSVRTLGHVIRIGVNFASEYPETSIPLQIQTALTLAEGWSEANPLVAGATFAVGQVLCVRDSNMAGRDNVATVLSRAIYREATRDIRCHETAVWQTMGRNNWRRTMFQDAVRAMILTGIVHLPT